MRTLAQRTINDRFPIKTPDRPATKKPTVYHAPNGPLRGKQSLPEAKCHSVKQLYRPKSRHDYDMYGPEGFDAVIKSMNINHEHQRALKAAKGEEVHDSNKETVDLISGIIKNPKANRR